tara:strand:+ start:260 stop:508 length:249 start_codon:yes stop_codon:yes gene_type:complete
MIPELPGLPELESTGLRKPAMKRLPTVPGGARMASRVEEQAQEAANIGAAFAFSRLQDKIMRAKARARGRAAQAAAEKRKRR